MGDPAGFCSRGRIRAGGVHQRHHGHLQSGGKGHPAPCLAVPGRQHVASAPGAGVRIHADHHDRTSAQPGQDDPDGRVVIAGPVAAEFARDVQGVEEGGNTRPVGGAGPLHLRPGIADGVARAVAHLDVHGRGRPGPCQQEPQGQRQVRSWHDGVDQSGCPRPASGVRPAGQRTARHGFGNPGSGEPDRRTRLGQHDIGQVGVGGEHSAGRRIAHHRDLQQPGLGVGGGRRGGGGHLHQGRHPFLHSRATRGGKQDDGQTRLAGRVVGRGDALTGDRAHRPAEEPELEGDGDHLGAVVPAEAAACRQDGFVRTGCLGGLVAEVVVAGPVQRIGSPRRATKALMARDQPVQERGGVHPRMGAAGRAPPRQGGMHPAATRRAGRRIVHVVTSPLRGTLVAAGRVTASVAGHGLTPESDVAAPCPR
jgi:hypothetical protein